MVVPVDEAGKLVLVKQFRYLWQRESIEFPAGGIKDPDPFVTARNELAEEANIGAAVWKFVGEYNPYNGATDEVAKVFFASGLANSIREKDASEEFEVLKMEISEFQTAIEAGVIWDGMTLAAWMIARPTVLEYLANVKLRK